MVRDQFGSHTCGTGGSASDDQPAEEEGQAQSPPLEHVQEPQTITDLATSGLKSFPPELLGLVFDLFVGAVAALNLDLICVTHVCRYWRDVALHWPALWSHIALMHPGAVEAFLTRSQTLPLHILADMKAKRNSARSWTMRREALQVLLGEAACGRILSLKINHLPSSNTFEWVLRHIARASQLEMLSIERQPPRGVVIFTHRSAEFEGVPKLRSLTLRYEIPPLFSKMPNSLSMLDLDMPWCGVPGVLDLLECSPSLEHLIIRGLSDANIGGVMGTVTLARLRTFHLQRLSARLITVLLSHIVFPCKHMNISLYDHIPAHNALIVLHFPALRCLKRVQLTWKNGIQTLCAYRSSELTPSVAPALQVQGSVSTDNVEGFLVNWPINASHIETVDINDDSTDLHLALGLEWRWETMLSAVPALRTLRVRAVTERILQAILSALKLPGAGTTACPQLETIILAQASLVGDSWDALAGTARLRGPLAGAGGCLAKIVVERPVTESPICDDQVLSLIKMTGVELIFTESQ